MCCNGWKQTVYYNYSSTQWIYFSEFDLFYDGYRSYTVVANSLGLSYCLVTHSAGFVASNENIRTTLKNLVSSEDQDAKINVVKSCNIGSWLRDYTFKRGFLVYAMQ